MKWFSDRQSGQFNSGDDQSTFFVIKLFGMGSLVRIAHELRAQGIEQKRIVVITHARNQEVMKFLRLKAVFISGESLFGLAASAWNVARKVRKTESKVVLDFERASNAVGMFRTFVSMGGSSLSYSARQGRLIQGPNAYVGYNDEKQTSLFELLRDDSCEEKGDSGFPREARSGRVIVNVNASNYIAERRFPQAKFAVLIKLLVPNYGDATITLIGAEGDVSYVNMMSEELDKIGVEHENMAGKWSLSELANEVAESQFMITNDSGPMHISHYLNVPTVVIWGPTDATKSGYAASKHVLNISSSLPCRPCFKDPKSKVALACEGRVDCMHLLNEQQMVSEIHRFTQSIYAVNQSVK